MSAKSSSTTAANTGGGNAGVSAQQSSSPAQMQTSVGAKAASTPVQAAPAESVAQKPIVLPSTPAPDNKVAKDSVVIDEKAVTDDVSVKKGGLRQSLFGETAPTREELMGVVRKGFESSDKPAGEAGEGGEKKPAEDGKSAIGSVDASQKADGEVKPKEGEAGAAGAEGDVGKKPEGEVKVEGDGKKPEETAAKVVPLAALREARIKMGLMKDELTNLRGALMDAEKRADGKNTTPVDDFKVLSTEEERALFDEDAFAYQKYKDGKAEHERNVESAKLQEKNEEQAINSARIAMNTIVPGVLENKDGIGDELTAMAAYFGMEPEVLSILTEPSVRVTLPGTKKSIPLGSGAVALVSMLHKVHGAIRTLAEFVPKDGKKPETVDMTKKEQELREQITKELMDKFKQSGTGFVSIGDASGSASEDAGKGGVGKNAAFSEAEYLKMSPEERRARLGGK